MIPKLIHYCWFGRGPMSDLNHRCIESWRRVLPDYDIVEWNEDNSDLDSDYCRATYGQGLWSKVSNEVRLKALHRHGGLYFDTDVEVIKRFDDLLGLDCFFGFQLVEPHIDWVNNAVIGARVGHPFLARCIESLHQTHARLGHIPRGPELITAVLRTAGSSTRRWPSRVNRPEMPLVSGSPLARSNTCAAFGPAAPATLKSGTVPGRYWRLMRLQTRYSSG